MSTLSLPYTLTAGTPENVTQVQANFDAVKAVINGNLDSTNIAALVDSGWTAVSFAGGWSGSDVKYRKIGNLVRLQGLATPGAGGTIFTLPSGYRPQVVGLFPVQTSTPGTFTYVQVGTDGVVGAGSVTAVYLTPVSFYID